MFKAVATLNKTQPAPTPAPLAGHRRNRVLLAGGGQPRRRTATENQLEDLDETIAGAGEHVQPGVQLNLQ